MGTVEPLTVAVKTTTSPTAARSGSTVRFTFSGAGGVTSTVVLPTPVCPSWFTTRTSASGVAALS